MVIARTLGLLLLIIVCNSSQPFSYFDSNLQPTNSSPYLVIDNSNPPNYVVTFVNSVLQVWGYPSLTLVSTLYNSANLAHIYSVFSSDFTWMV